MPLSGGAKAPNHPPKESSKRENFHQFRITLFALTLSLPNLAWKYETSSQSKWLIGRDQISNYDVTFADVIPHVNCKILNLPIFHTVFERTIQGELKAEKIFQYLKYELTYNILNLDKFGAQKWDTPFESPLLFKLNITHLYCRNLKEKEIWKKEIPNCTWKTFCDVIICLVIIFLVCLN